MIKTKVAAISNAIYTKSEIIKRVTNKYVIRGGVFEYYVIEKEEFPYDYFASFTSALDVSFELRSDKKEASQQTNFSDFYSVKCRGTKIDFDSAIIKLLMKLTSFYLFVNLKKNNLEIHLTSNNLLEQDDWIHLHQLICALTRQFHLLPK